jgi:preprotein translocase subunit SecA
MDHLKEGVGLRGYGQRDPLVEYKREAFEIFSDLSDRVASEVVARLMKVQIAREDRMEQQFAPKPAKMTYGRGGGGESTKPQTVVKDKKIGRNDPCICGSGKKYKKCCGINA